MKVLKSKKFKITVISVVLALVAVALALTGVLIYSGLKQDKDKNDGGSKSTIIVNPLSFSIDAWDGKTVNANDFKDDYAKRGSDTITIDSAASFIHFVNQVNNGVNYANTTIYLNTSIDLQGHTINSIGTSEHPFFGTFDGGYYTIYNANINGNGLFGTTENAEIKNVGLYNCNIRSFDVAQDDIVGGLIGKATNTNITNTFVKGTINGNKVGGLVGEYVSSNGEHAISNSFVDASINAKEIGGLVHTTNVNNSNESQKSIVQCYYMVGESEIYVKIGNCYTEKAFKPNSIEDFKIKNSNDYISGLSDYDYLKNSTKLNFTYPIQSGFVKVYLTGSYYECVLNSNGNFKNISSIETAFNEASTLTNSELNLIVDRITLSGKAILSNSATLTINSSKNVEIIRSQSSSDAMLVTSSSSLLTIGSDSSEYTITINGNREYVEANNLNSSAIISVDFANIIINKNVVLKDNINNVSGNGGAVSIQAAETNPIINAKISNCFATKAGGAVYSYGVAIKSVGYISDCSTNGNGGGVAVINCDTTENTNLSGGISNCSAMNGGAIYSESSITISADSAISFTNNTATNNGGAIYGNSSIVSILSDVIFENNRASNGGAIYGNSINLEGATEFNNNSSTADNNSIIYGEEVISIFDETKFKSNKSTVLCSNEIKIEGKTTFVSNNKSMFGKTIYLSNTDLSKQNDAIIVNEKLIVRDDNVFNKNAFSHVELDVNATIEVDTQLTETIKIYKNSINYYSGSYDNLSFLIIDQNGKELLQQDKVMVVNMPENCVLNYNNILSNQGAIVRTAKKPNLVSKSFYYDFSEKSVVPDGYDSEFMEISDYKAIIAGNYKLKVSLKSYYVWEDEVNEQTQSELTSDWSIEYPILNVFDGNGNKVTSIYTKYNSDEVYSDNIGNVSTTLSDEKSTNEGYNFVGWFTELNGGSQVATEYGNLIANVDGFTQSNSTWGILEHSLNLYERWTIKTFTVTWLNENGDELEKDENVAYGTVPSYDGANPTKESTAQYSYVFDCWYANGKKLDKDYKIAGQDDSYKIVGETTIQASYISALNKYTVMVRVNDESFGNLSSNGETLKEITINNVEYGSIFNVEGNTFKINNVLYATAIPVESDGQHTYTFAYWEIVTWDEVNLGDIVIVTAVVNKTINP